LINPKNDDQECFKYATLAHFAVKQKIAHPERVSVLKKLAPAPVVWPEEIEFPFSTTDISLLEEANPDYTWAVYGLSPTDDKSKPGGAGWAVIPLWSTTPDKYHSRELINVLQYEYENHYVYIKDLDKTLSSRGQECAHCPICIKRFIPSNTKKDHKHKRDQHTLNCKATWRYMFEPRGAADSRVAATMH
jgi:hypothetical protein